MSFPYWPGAPVLSGGGGAQTLTYISTSQTVGITPNGNTIQLNIPGAVENGAFSTITFGGSSNPALFMNNKTIALNNAASQVAIGTAGIAWNNTTSNIQILAPSTTSVVVGTNSNADVLRVSDAGVFASPFISTPQLFVSTINGALLTQSTLTLNGGTNQILLESISPASAVIYATGNGLNLSTIKSINGGIPMTQNIVPFNDPINFQTGYIDTIPNLSTVLFASPFQNDSVCVTLTPTNKAVSAGASPNLTLHQFFGANGNGVSSIGFQVDARDNGSAYSASFFYVATSL